jgi:hypothetical protein
LADLPPRHKVGPASRLSLKPASAGEWSTAVELRWTRCAPWLLPLPAERGEGWGEGNPLGLARSSSPLPSPPLAGGEGKAAVSCAAACLIQRQCPAGVPPEPPRSTSYRR